MTKTSILNYAIIRKVKKQTFYITVKTKSNIFIFLKLLFAVHIFIYLCGLGCFGGSSAVWACWLHPFSYTHDTGTTRACWFHPFSYNHDTGTTRTCWFVMSVRKGVKLACSGSTPFFTLMIMTKVQPERMLAPPLFLHSWHRYTMYYRWISSIKHYSKKNIYLNI